MKKKRLRWQLYRPHLLIILVAVGAVSWYAARTIGEFYAGRVAVDLGARARLMEDRIRAPLLQRDWRALDRLCKELGRKISMRVTVVLGSGRVVGDSEEEPAAMGNQANWSEIVDALEGEVGSAVRYSETLRQKMLYVAVPVKKGQELLGVVRTAVPFASLDDALHPTWMRILLGALVAVVLAGAVSLAVSRRISRPLERMKRDAQRLAQGELGSRLPVPESEELGGLAEAVNQMASQLEGRIHTAIRQRSELEAVLSSMIEGVIAVDVEERVISMNEAAGRLFGVDPAKVQGQTIQEVVRNHDLLRFVARTLASLWPVEGDIGLHDGGGKLIQAHGTILHDPEGRGTGALIVLNDVTRIRRLESVRRDFVANVAHEIRTPVTSIKGFVETLLDGALEDQLRVRDFLNIILRQADRLNAIIEDLLTLSRIEEKEERAEITLGEGPIADVLEGAVQLCHRKAAAKRVEIHLGYEADMKARINPSLLEQALVNLIDNAINYSPEESEIAVEAKRENAEIVVSVRDHGCGIAEEHLSRLFERFYRIDKARSRDLGGTGLGLAIVKHIAQAHRGRVTVESSPGKGSTFRIHLPSLS